MMTSTVGQKRRPRERGLAGAEVLPHAGEHVCALCRAGFTLIEVIVTMVLLTLLMTVSVINFSGMLTSGQLEDGTEMVASALRMMRAESAIQGRRFELVFDSETNEMAVMWEADPLGDPQVFSYYEAGMLGNQMPNDLVTVVSSQRIEEGDLQQSGEDTEVMAGEEDESAVLDSIRFYPDGTCDSAVIELAGRNGEDRRHARLEINGLIGTVTVSYLLPEEE